MSAMICSAMLWDMDPQSHQCLLRDLFTGDSSVLPNKMCKKNAKLMNKCGILWVFGNDFPRFVKIFPAKKENYGKSTKKNCIHSVLTQYETDKQNVEQNNWPISSEMSVVPIWRISLFGLMMAYPHSPYPNCWHLGHHCQWVQKQGLCWFHFVLCFYLKVDV